MYAVTDIRHVHLEISSRCNAECPLCPRNFHGYPYNDGYVEHDMTLSEAKKIFSSSFLKQIDKGIFINGNFGDIVMNPWALDIIEYFRNHMSHRIVISTNGAARSNKFWKKLAELNCEIFFCLDGLNDTHHLYRQNTRWETVIKNAQTFISAGGRAIWKMIEFEHNKHQISEAEKLSKEMGFFKFDLVQTERVNGPVFDRNGNLTHVIGSTSNVNFQHLVDIRTQGHSQLQQTELNEINCNVKRRKSLYVTSTGDIYPCCWTGFNPKKYGTYGHHKLVNTQIRPLVKENNALEHDLETCIKWFDNIVDSWSIEKYKDGRLIICDQICGK